MILPPNVSAQIDLIKNDRLLGARELAVKALNGLRSSIDQFHTDNEKDLEQFLLTASKGFVEIMYDVMVSNGVVEQREPTTPSGPSGYVGGEVFSANKLAVLSPYLALIGLVGVISTVVAVKRRRA